MTHEPPPDDYFVLLCRGLCGKFMVVELRALLRTLKNTHATFQSFSYNFICDECTAAFTIALENLAPITLNDDPHPN